MSWTQAPLKSTLFILTFALILPACGGRDKDSGPSKIKPLTQTQKSKIANFTESIDVAMGATEMAGKAKQSPNPFRRFAALTDSAKLRSSIAMPSEAAKQEKIRSLAKILENAVCKFQDNLPEPSENTLPQGKFEFSFSGANCPIHMVTSVIYSGQSSNSYREASVQMAHVYAVQDSAYGALNDVSSMNIKGGFSAKGGQENSTGSGGFNGLIRTREFGTVEATISKSFTANSKTFHDTTVMRLSFSNFVAVGKIVTNYTSQGVSAQHTINDQVVTSKEFRDVFGGFLMDDDQEAIQN